MRTATLTASVPTIAFCRPSCVPAVVSVSRLGLSTGSAWARMLAMMSIAGAMIRTSAIPHSVQKMTARPWLRRGLDTSTHRKRPARDAAHHEPPREVGQQAHREEQKPELRKRVHAHASEVTERAVERRRDPGGDRAAVAEDIGLYTVDVADNQQDRDRLSEGARPPEQRCGDDARADVRDRNHPGGLVASHAERVSPFFGEDWHTAEQHQRCGGDDRDDHHCEHEARGQQTLADADRRAEERDDVAQRADRGIDVRGDEGTEDRDPPEAEHDAGDPGEQLEED